MRIVVDTNVLWNLEAVARLAEQPADLVVPAVVYAERLRQFAKQRVPRQRLDDHLARNRCHVEPFGTDEAARFVPRLTDDKAWRRLDRDAMIAGHVGPADVVWTSNPKDFLAVGLREDQVVGV